MHSYHTTPDKPSPQAGSGWIPNTAAARGTHGATSNPYARKTTMHMVLFGARNLLMQRR
jgi:hypothetical protein